MQVIRLDSSWGRTDWVKTPKKCVCACGCWHKRRGEAFVTSTSLHHNRDLVSGCFSAIWAPVGSRRWWRPWLWSQGSREPWRSLHTLEHQPWKDCNPSSNSTSSQSPNRRRRMHCLSVGPFNVCTQCSDCADREWVEWRYTESGRGCGRWVFDRQYSLFTVLVSISWGTKQRPNRQPDEPVDSLGQSACTACVMWGLQKHLVITPEGVFYKQFLGFKYLCLVWD